MARLQTEPPVQIVNKNEPPDKIVQVGEKDTMPPNLYKEAGRMPYLLDLIPSGEFAYKTFNVKDLSQTIDDYINSKTDSRESYQKEYRDLMKRAGIKSDDVYIIIDKLSEFVRIENKLLEAVREKEEFEQKPIDEMSSKELRRKLLGK